MNILIGKLFPGPLDILGDIHGEIEALRSLAFTLGYDARGLHPQGRRLVFIGDLIDRGPDSPAVVEWVQSLVEAGSAQCILGNHELNVLRTDAKAGNGWIINPEHPEQQPGGEFEHSRTATGVMRERYLAFFRKLPLALVREDVRVVHAAWHSEAVRQLTGETGSVVEVYERHAVPARQRLKDDGVVARADAEVQQWRHALSDRHAQVPLLPALGVRDVRFQMSNPVRILTSGVERLAQRPFFSAGKWRMCDRVRWWDEYTEDPAVVIGHYWRRLLPTTPTTRGTALDMFEGVGPHEWMGPRRNVFCVDYSVGGRYLERHEGVTVFSSQLCALRWPEREIWGESGPLAPPA